MDAPKLEITEEELLKELELLRINPPHEAYLTELQFTIIDQARAKEPVVKWNDIRALFVKHNLGDFITSTLQHRYMKETERRAGMKSESRQTTRV